MLPQKQGKSNWMNSNPISDPICKIVPSQVAHPITHNEEQCEAKHRVQNHMSFFYPPSPSQLVYLKWNGGGTRPHPKGVLFKTQHVDLRQLAFQYCGSRST